MKSGALGKMYQDGEIIIRQGDTGDCMYVVQEGWVEVVVNQNHKEVRLALRGAGEFFGEMELFDHEVRMATVRALGGARVLTVDKRNFMRRIHEDPSLAYRLVQTMSHRLRDMSAEVTRLNLQLEPNVVHEYFPVSRLCQRES